MKCKECGFDFDTSVDNRRGERGNYCSDTCVDIQLQKRRDEWGVRVDNCVQCGNTMPKRGIKKGVPPRCCSKICLRIRRSEWHALYDSTEEQRARRIIVANRKDYF